MRITKQFAIVSTILFTINARYVSNVIKGESKPEFMATPSSTDGPRDIVHLSKILSQYEFDDDKKNEKYRLIMMVAQIVVIK